MPPYFLKGAGAEPLSLATLTRFTIASESRQNSSTPTSQSPGPASPSGGKSAQRRRVMTRSILATTAETVSLCFRNIPGPRPQASHMLLCGVGAALCSALHGQPVPSQSPAQMAAVTSCASGMSFLCQRRSSVARDGPGKRGMVLAGGRVSGVPSSHTAEVCWVLGERGVSSRQWAVCVG